MVISPKKRVQAFIRLARMKNNWKQEELAERLGVRQTLVSRWESGAVSPSAEILFKIADEMGMDIGLVEKQN